MHLTHVTITGADDDVDQFDLFDLSVRFPFVEWGVLFSQSKAGVPRYPSWDWVLGLAEMKKTIKHKTPKFSAHLCGKWVSDALTGRISIFNNEPELNRLFHRIQLNCGKSRLKEAIENKDLWRAAMRVSQSVILGGNYGNLKLDLGRCSLSGVYPLFDASGGHGKKPKDWPLPFSETKTEGVVQKKHTQFCGYAGGLGPDNVAEELDRIEHVVGHVSVWIDMESGVRTKDKFDLNKVEEVLEKSARWVI
jgi:hypothetical protein